MSRNLFFLLFTFIPFLSLGDTKEQSTVVHHHSNWEVASSLGGVYLLSEAELAVGFHMHILKTLENWNRLSLGLGFEMVFDDHSHLNLGFVAKYQMWKGIKLLASPGISFQKEQSQWAKKFSFHIELLYEFHRRNLHFGPALGYSYSKLDKHISLGLHVGYSF